MWHEVLTESTLSRIRKWDPFHPTRGPDKGSSGERLIANSLISMDRKFYLIGERHIDGVRHSEKENEASSSKSSRPSHVRTLTEMGNSSGSNCST